MSRPKNYDPDTALALIRDAFWLNGYEATSLADLVNATGIQKASLYSAFGNKREMFCKALVNYDQSRVQTCVAMMADKKGREALKTLLYGPVEAVAKGDRRGCLLCNALSEDASISDHARQITARGRTAMLEAIGKALAESDASHIQSGEVLALYFGMQVLARGGAAEADLRRIARSAIERI
ncbi:MAG: helix-turn-helix domain-containing protein [Hyphomonadaceae bacterium]